jgi:hypothetical protein
LEKNSCGVVPLNLASKSISSSFVGILAGAFVIAELVRASNCDHRYDLIHAQIRCLRFAQAFQEGNYLTEAARNGMAGVRI